MSLISQNPNLALTWADQFFCNSDQTRALLLLYVLPTILPPDISKLIGLIMGLRWNQRLLPTTLHIFLLSHFFKAHRILWSDMHRMALPFHPSTHPVQNSLFEFYVWYFHLTYYKGFCFFLSYIIIRFMSSTLPFIFVWSGWFLFCLSV